MIVNMPELHPGEFIFGWFSRYHKDSGNISYEDTIKELFGCSRIHPNVYYPLYLEYFCDQLPKSWGYTPEYLILNHSIIPFFLPFMKDEQFNRIITEIKAGNSKQIKNYIGINAGTTFKENVIKICPQCYKQDKDKYGEAIIHTKHQVQGCLICSEHKQYLIEYKIPDNTHVCEFFDINNIEMDFDNIQKKPISKALIDLTQDTDDLLKGALKGYNISKVKEKYSDKMFYEGYCSYKGTLKAKKFIKDFLLFYQGNILELFNGAFNINEKSFWVKCLLMNTNIYIHPIFHLLTIKFLFGSVDEFNKYEPLYRKQPFGSSGWPCLNPVCTHYKENVIQKCDIKSYSNHATGYFKCPYCGYEYYRRGPDKDANARFTGAISCYGPIWENKLAQLASQGYSNNKISSIMGCCPKTIKRQLGNLGLINNLDNNSKPQVKNQRERKSKYGELNIYDCRNIAVNFFTQYKNAIRSDFGKAFPYIYKKLCSEDRPWLDLTIPIKKKWDRHSRMRDYSYRLERDKEISKKIYAAAYEILLEIPLRRVSISYIQKKVSYSLLFDENMLKKMPCTKKVLKERIESKETFLKRKIDYIIRNRKENNEETTDERIKHLLRLKDEEYEKLKCYINEVILKYYSNTI